MKRILRLSGAFLAFCLLFGMLSTAGFADAGAVDGCEKVEAVNTDGIVSDFTEFIEANGKTTSYMSGHGTGQTRAAYVPSGTYFALFTCHETADPLEWTLFRANPDGTTEALYTDRMPYNPSGPTIHVMADKNEDIWAYAGWRVSIGNEKFSYNLYHYDVDTGKITTYSTIPNYYLPFNSSEGGGGYSMCCIDAERGEIYALSNGGDKPGSMEWIVFDLETKEWSAPKGVELDYRYCYNFMQPDGNGGFHCIGMRDVRAEAVITDVGLNVKVAGEQYHSRWTNNNMLFDEWDYFHMPSALEAAIEGPIPVEEAQYDVLNGMFPDCPVADVYTDQDGLLHFIYCIRNNITPGYRSTHVIYDTSDGLKEVARRNYDFLSGSNNVYNSIMTQTEDGAFYVLTAKGELDESILEIWRADSPTDELRLVWAEKLPFTPSEFQLPSSRNASTPSDVLHLGVYAEGTWFYFTVDLTVLGEFIAR